MSYFPEDKVRMMIGFQTSPDWAILCERIDQEIKGIESEISLSLKKRNYDRASHLNGKKEMCEFLKGLPMKIKRDNQGIVERVREMIAGAME